MQSKIGTVLMVSAGMMAGALGTALVRLMPPAQAAPVAAKPAAAAANPLGDMLAGKTFPLTVSAEQMNTGYRLVALVDAQGKPSLYATQGQTTSAGSETYLVAYEVTLTDLKTNPIPQPKPGTTGQIIFIDLHAIQAMGGIIPIQPAPSIAPATP